MTSINETQPQYSPTSGYGTISSGGQWTFTKEGWIKKPSIFDIIKPPKTEPTLNVVPGSAQKVTEKVVSTVLPAPLKFAALYQGAKQGGKSTAEAKKIAREEVYGKAGQTAEEEVEKGITTNIAYKEAVAKGYTPTQAKLLAQGTLSPTEQNRLMGMVIGSIMPMKKVGEVPEPIKPLAKEVKIKPPKTPIPPTILPQEMTTGKIGDPIAKLNQVLKEANPIRKGMEKAYTAERAKRIAQVDEFINTQIDNVGGEEGYATILSKLKGELIPQEYKIAFEPLKEKITEADLKGLFNKTWKHPYLDNWEKINSAEGLTKLLSGEIPQKSQLVLMEEVYGTDLMKTILSKRMLGAKVKDLIIETINIPRVLLATADMSGFLRQGVIEIAAHPIIAGKAIGKTFQFAFSPKSFTQYFEDLPKDPLYSLMRKSKLAITDPSRIAGGLVAREETFISRLLQKIPIFGEITKFAERSYTGFLSKLRVDVFKNYADELLSKGFSPVKDAEIFKSVANMVNTFTGRGSLGAADKVAAELSVGFFSPRLIASRFNALNPIWYAKMPKEIRMKAIGDFAKFVGVGLTTLGLIKLAAGDNIDIELDPRSSDFGKIRMGNTRWDIWGGFQQWARVFAQLITGERKDTTTGEIISLNKEEYPFTTRKEVLLRFIEGKLAPVPALVNELMSGAKTFTGEDMTFETVVKEKFIPMYIQDISDVYQEGGLGRAIGAGVPAFFGVGVQTWFPKEEEFKVKDYTQPSTGGFKVKNYSK